MFNRVLAVPLLALLVLAPAARADEPLATTPADVQLSADAGAAAWVGTDGQLMLRLGAGPVARTNLKLPAAPIDVGRGARGGAQLVYAARCSTRTGRCDVRSIALHSGALRSALLTRIPYRGGGAPALAIEGRRLVYAVHGTTGSAKQRSACDVPYTRVGDGAARKLDRGHCAAIDQLDVENGRIAMLAEPALTYGSGVSDARLLRTSGGPSKLIQHEAQGEESNFIGAVALDGGSLYTVRGGIRQANVFTRFSLATGKRRDARAFTSLGGGFARDAGRDVYVESTGYESECPTYAGATCTVVAGDDPFSAASRLLTPRLRLALTPQPIFVDRSPQVVATLTRERVDANGPVGGPLPLAGVRVELLQGSVDFSRKAQPPPSPTGHVAKTGADGTATIAPVLPLVPFPFFGARTLSGVPVQTPDTTSAQVYVHMIAKGAMSADGKVQVSGTIIPPQPGRKVRLDRRVELLCKNVAPGRISPSSAGTPPGCVNRWTENPISVAAVSADGGSFSVAANSPAGTYRVALDFAGGANVYAGESSAFDVP
jgi:hypothetical protein